MPHPQKENSKAMNSILTTHTRSFTFGETIMLVRPENIFDKIINISSAHTSNFVFK